MRLRIATMFVLAAALSLEATAASAQGTDSTRRARSTTRIPVTKEAPGEVVPPRVDTVMIYRTDTLRVFRTDTVTHYRTDTVRVEVRPPMPKPLRQIGGFYYGLAMGAALTEGDFGNAQSDGFHIQVPIGWDPIQWPLGVRLDGTYSTFTRTTLFDNDFNNLDLSLGNAQVYTFNANLKLRVPMLSKFASRWQVYGIGGGSYSWFKNVVQPGNGFFVVGDSVVVNPLITTPGTTVIVPVDLDRDWHGSWGWNAGGGVQYGWGRANVYVESRVISFNRTVNLNNLTINGVTFNGDNRFHLNQVPIVLGFTWF